MTNDEVAEASAALGVMLAALYGTARAAAGKPAADLFYALGDLSANAATVLRGGAIGTALWNAFGLAVGAGATVATMENARAAMLAQSPVSLPAIAVVNAGIRMALAAEVKILAATTFTSQQDVMAALVAIDGAFDAAEEYAADNHDPAVYQALIGAHAAVVRDLTARARPLPKLITYSTARGMTSHALANLLYGDASRADELRQEGKVIHPAFMPATGPALSE